MRKNVRLLAWLLVLVMIFSSVPMSVFAAETSSTLTYGSDMDNDTTLQSYKQYEGFISDTKYVQEDVKITVYIDMANATDVLDVIMYVINWNDEGVGRIGTDSDVDIVTDLVESEASVETGNRAAVVVVDYGKNPLAKAPLLKNSLYVVRKDNQAKEILPVWADDTHTTTENITVNEYNNYIIPAGYRLARDIPFFEQDVHASLGTIKASISSWNNNVAGAKNIYYAYHTGDDTCTYDHTTYADVECVLGAPQEIDGVVVEHEKQKAPKVSRAQDMREPDGSPVKNTMRLDIAYPSGEDVAATPVYVKINSSAYRSMNSAITAKNYSGTSVDYERGDLMDMVFSGCTIAINDHSYFPHERSTAYGHFDDNGSYMKNSAKVARATIRCIRYYAETYGYNADLIGIGGISKASPAAGVLALQDNKNVTENESYSYTIDGESVKTRGLYYEGDLNADGTVTEGRTVQPYMTYEQGYDGTVEYTGTKTGEISSDVTVAYSAAGNGPRWLCGEKSSTDMKIGTTHPVTGKTVMTVPTIHTSGFYDQFKAWTYIDDITERFTEYSTTPFIIMPMEDRGHEIANGIDPLRDYDRAETYRQFVLSYLMPDKFVNSVAYITPVDGDTEVSLLSNIQVQLIKPASSLADFVAEASVKNSSGDDIEGEWTTNDLNTSGLYTFVPASILVSGTEYTVAVGDGVVGEAVSKSFTTETAGYMRPVADTYVSSVNKDTVYGSSEDIYIDAQRTYFVSFKTSDLDGANKAMLNLHLAGSGSQTISIYLVDDYKVDEATLCYSNMPTLSDDMLVDTYEVSEGDSEFDLLGVADLVEGEYFTLAVKGSAYYYEMNFEQFDEGTLKSKTNNVVEGDYTHYHGYYDTTGFEVRNGGSLKERKIIDYSGNKVFRNQTPAATNQKYGGYSKIYNALYDNVNTFSSDLAGKTFNYSVDAMFVGDLISGAKMEPMVEIGFIRSAQNSWLSSDKVTFTADTANKWTTLGGTYTVPESEIAKKVTSTDAPKNRISDPMFGLYAEDERVGTDYYTYYFDNIIISEEAPSALTSREDTSVMSAYISLSSRPTSGALADTYVSQQYPDAVYGKNNELIMSGGTNENIIFATFSSSIIDEKGILEVIFPASNEAATEAELWLLDGYYVNESKLSYNNMPDLAEAVSLGKHTITGGTNVIELDCIDEIKSKYFTVAFKSTDSSAHGYRNDFEGYSVGQTFSDGNGDTGNSTLDNNVYDETNTDILHYYAHTDNERGIEYTLARRSGIIDYRKIVDEDGNQALGFITSTSQTYGGRLKFYNALLDRVATADDVGRTFRFSVNVKSRTTGTPDKAKVTASAMLSYGAVKIERDTAPIATAETATAEQLKSGWVTLTVDYTVSAEDIASLQNSGKVYAYPMFALDFADDGTTSSYCSYLVDDISVVELDEDGNERAAVVSSYEGAETANDTLAITSRIVGAPVADTYISRANPDTVYGAEDTLMFGDGNGDKKAMVLSFPNSVLDDGKYVLLNMPNEGKAVKDISVYYLLDYVADETTLTWNNMPDYEDNLLCKIDLAAGENRIDVSGICDKLEGVYFTLIFRTESHTYGNNFENYTTGASGGVTGNDVVDENDSSITHYYGFTDTSSIGRKGGSFNSATIVEETNGNKALRINTLSSAAYGGRYKFYNSVSYGIKAEVGATYRFTARVRAADGETKTNAKVAILAAPSYGSYAYDYFPGKNTEKQLVSDYTNVTSSAWVTISYDYTVREQDIACVSYDSSGKVKAGILSYPMFGLECYDNNSSAPYKYLIDDIVVSEIIDGEIVNTVTAFASREAGGNLRFVSGLDNVVSVIESTASSSSEGDVISIVDGGATYSLVSAENGKLAFGDVVLCDSKGNEFALSEEDVSVVAIYDDVNGTVRFAVGNSLAYYKDGEEVKATFELPAIEGGVGEKATFGTSEMKASKLKHTTSEIVGFQTNDVNRAIRFISGVDALYYTAAGFKVETAGGTAINKGSTTVYSSIVADDKTVYSTETGYNYLSAISITEVGQLDEGDTAEKKIKITPYLGVGENEILGETVYYSVSVVDGVLQVTEIAESDFTA